MNAFRQSDWDASPRYPSNVEAPYLMSTGVVTGEDRGARPLSPPHAHADAMLAWCYRGTVWVHLRDAMWQLAPGQGIWVPPGVPHTAHHEQDSVGCYTYLPASAATAPTDGIRRVLVPRAVQEMLLHLGINDMPTGPRVRIQSVLIEMLQQPIPDALADRGEVPLPTDDRVRALAQSVLDDPGDPRSVAELCAAHGLHERTVMRIFQSDVGMSFGKWRTGVRLTLGARLIVDGMPIGAAAHRCGYATTSAFSASFKERFGITPRQHVAGVHADAAHQSYWR
ncbi:MULTISPECIES: AraC family transcriptional regulator [Microbacterium]|uniref:AraC family transcriptional regulator n=1 Tax=Microbacterium TaxID=33882 RepID=UPI002782BB2F|nr:MULTISPECIES: AraC family transcriptional regulator [Microbacterium]MDQ1082779.1 AraC-like DNA-binding protein [Microbacterium sp. SORGH_AS_0344]MDQ1168451.1 AraC-like DNA-binding protein [Microbacterium proteolyticum]